MVMAELQAGQGGDSGGGAGAQRSRPFEALCHAAGMNVCRRVESSASYCTKCWFWFSVRGSIILAVYQPGGKSSSGSGWHHIATLCLFRSPRARVGVAVFPVSMRRCRFHAAWVRCHS